MVVRMLIAALALIAVALATLPLAAEDRPSNLARTPGTIRLRGNPDRVHDVRMTPAFPQLRFNKPLYVGHVPDGSNRMVVLEQDGRMLLFPNRSNVRQADVVTALDMRGKVYRKHPEEGLLGLAFHPQFRTNHEIFVHYSAARPRRGVIARFKMDRAHRSVRMQTHEVVLQQRQPWGNHNGGGLEFGPDGYLYITFGDGGASNDRLNSGQDRSTWLGAMLRVDINRKPYAVPRDNPFVGQAGVRPEIWAYGLRNVWRFSFDRKTGDLWAGDVGQNAWEEIDILTAGGNFGWNVKEGSKPFRMRQTGPLIDPVIDHDTSEARSITGGYVYRGQRIPALRGTYLYADYATGNVWGLRYDGTRVVHHRLLGRGRSVASFGEDAAGEVYFTSFDGRVYTFAQRQARESAPTFPQTLSATGLFASMRPLTPHRSLLPYDVNVPLWSDGTDKTRHIMLPGMQRIHVESDGTYVYPDGTIFVKTFHAAPSQDKHRLETRVMLKRPEGWGAYTYRWNAAQSDAVLLDARQEVQLPASTTAHGLPDRWTFPSRGDCMSCHTAAAGRVLGFRTEQLAGNGSLERLVRQQVFTRDPRTLQRNPTYAAWSSESSDAALVRAYLDANCAMCHQPGAPGNAAIDLRATSPLARTNMLDVRPTQGDLAIPNARVIAPGAPQRSVLLERMRRTDALGMPNLGHHRVDDVAVKRVTKWIRQMATPR